MSLNGRQKVAAFLLSLDTQTASAILAKFSESEIDDLTREMLAMRSLEHEVIELVHKEYMDMVSKAGDFIPDTRPLTEELITSAIGKEKGREVLGQSEGTAPRRKPFASLANADARQLADLLRLEHPQTIAVVLSHLTPQVAGQTLSRLPEDLHSDVVVRMTNLENAQGEMLSRLDDLVTGKIQSVEPKAGADASEESRNKMVAEILNVVGKEIRKKALDEIGKESPDRAKLIENLMFVFEDFVGVDDRSIRKIVMEVDNDTLALALKTASEELKSKFLRNLSKRASQTVLETLQNLGPKPLSEVETAQHELLRAAHSLDEQGEIAMRRGEQEQLV
jgi:flagellar motor switch protein FliG